MRQDKLKILCQGFWWSPETIGQHFEKMTFIANETQPANFTDEIDLTPFIIRESLEDIEYNLEELAISENGKANEKYFLSSALRFDIIGGVKSSFKMKRNFSEPMTTGDYSMDDFFRITEDTSYIKYKVSVRYKINGIWKTIYKGVIEQDGLTATYSRDNNNEIIKIQVYGYEKQFKEYFEKKQLPSLYSNSFYTCRYYIREYKQGGFDLVQPKYNGLYGIFNPIFLGTYPDAMYFDIKVNMKIGSITYDENNFSVIDIPHFTKYGGSNFDENHFIFYKNGYERIRADNETIFGFIKKLCNSMGWVFFFAMVQPVNPNSDYELRFCIRDRFARDTAQSFKIDNNLIDKAGIKITKCNSEPTVQAVIIPNGEFKGGYNKGVMPEQSFMFASPNFWGKRIIILNESNNLIKTSGGSQIAANHFDFVSEDGQEGYNGVRFYPYAQEVSKDDNEYKFFTAEGIKKTGDYAEPDLITQYSYGSKDILIIDAGVNKTGRQIDGTNKIHSDMDVTESSQTSDRAMYFTGCYGECLSIQAGINGKYITYNYEDFVKTENFRNNFLKFKAVRSNLTVELSYLGIITNPNQSIQFENNPKLSNEKFSISNLKFNLEKGKTEITLTK